MIHSVQLVFGAALTGNVVKDVAVTAYASETDRKRSLEAGYQIHIAKPFPPEKLMAAVAKLVDENRQTVAKKE